MENEKNEELITIEVPITAVEHGSMTLSLPPNTALDEIEQTVLALERYGNAVWEDRKVTVDSIPMPDSKESVEESASKYPEELKEYLLEQGIWEREVDELLGNFSQEVSEDDLNIVAIFDSAVDLGQNYIDNVVGELDHHINSVLDYTALGEQIAESCDEYVSLSSGRIVEFEL